MCLVVDAGWGCQTEHLYIASWALGLPYRMETELHEQGSQESKPEGRYTSFL